MRVKSWELRVGSWELGVRSQCHKPIANNQKLTPEHDVLHHWSEVGLDFLDNLRFVPEEFEFKGCVLHADEEDAVAQVLAAGELGAHRSHILRPTVEQHLLVHQVLLPRLAHKPANQFFKVHFVVVSHWGFMV